MKPVIKELLEAAKEAEDAIGHDKYGTGDRLRKAIAAVERKKGKPLIEILAQNPRD